MRTFALWGVGEVTHPAGVRFTPEGFPDFSPYSVTSVRVRNLTGDYDLDAPLANRAAGLVDVPDGYVWHHVEEGNTLMLIPQELHRAVRHTGGAAVIREGARQVQEAP